MEGQCDNFNAREINWLYDLPCDSKAEGNRVIAEPLDSEINDALTVVTESSVEWNTMP